jgi:CubicO group peptidase (beta-lactamase class C family)
MAGIRLITLLGLMLLSPVSFSGDLDAESLADFTLKGMELWHVPGMSVAVVSSDEVLFQQGFGKTAMTNGEAVDEHTLFAIASTTKAMLAAGILILAEENRLSLDDLVIKHLPELHFSDPALTRQVTVRDLLAHRTGLPSTNFWIFFQDMSLNEQMKRLQFVEPIAAIRTRLIYQNTMYELAGLILERLSGQSWDRFLTEQLWRPIGMHETVGARGLADPQLSLVTPHYYLDGKLTVADWDWPADHKSAAGSVWSSLHDMSLWVQFLLRGGVTEEGDFLISTTSLDQMFEPQQLVSTSDFYPAWELTKPNWRSYGLGWYQQDFQGRMIDFHTGSLGGLIALIGLDRANDKALIVLGNRDHAEMRHALMWEVMDHDPAPQRRDWNHEIFELYEERAGKNAENWRDRKQQRLKNTKTSLPRAAYTGRYRSQVNGDVLIEPLDRSLVLRTAQKELRMVHWHLDTFLVEYKPWDMQEFISFQIDSNGYISSVQLLGDTFERVAESD